MHRLALDDLSGGRPTILQVAREKFLKSSKDGVEIWEINDFRVVLDTRNDLHVTRWYYYLEFILITIDPSYTKFKREYGSACLATCIDMLFSISPTNKIVLAKEHAHMATDPTVKAFLEAAEKVTVPNGFNGVDILGLILDNVIANGGEAVATPILTLDQMYTRALENREKITSDEMNEWHVTQVANRDVRRKNSHNDAISKLVSNVYPSKLCDVSTKFAEPLINLIKEVGTEYDDIIVGGSGVQNNFGVLIRFLFPKSKLHFVDVNFKCERAALSIPNSIFVCGDVRQYVLEHPGIPVISDAVKSFQKGTGKDRGTWIKIDDNVHQLVLLDMAKKGKIPWAVCKLPAPFGSHPKAGPYLDQLLLKNLDLYGSVRYHNGETLAVAIHGKKKPSTKNDSYLVYLKKCFLVEKARQHSFLWGLFPTTNILKQQVANADEDKDVISVVQEAFRTVKINAVPASSKPAKKKDADGEGLFSTNKEFDFSEEIPNKGKKGDNNNVTKEPKQEWKQKEPKVKFAAKPGQTNVKTDGLKSHVKVEPRDRSTDAKTKIKMGFSPAWSLDDIMLKFKFYGEMEKEQRILWKSEHKEDYKQHIEDLISFVYDCEESDCAPTTDEVMSFLEKQGVDRWLVLHTMSKAYSRCKMHGSRWYLNKPERERYEEAKLTGVVGKTEKVVYYD